MPRQPDPHQLHVHLPRVSEARPIVSEAPAIIEEATVATLSQHLPLPIRACLPLVGPTKCGVYDQTETS